ncbi:hypothetical protein HRG_007023 [Hirsutella rhossiliensis]|uniref:Pal1-like protein n=1 Tax=Hirsutella rhossiliensis TaxID=111463 RepID=A0A9P8MTT3_9HYPO|nr:uncharacterized protein HRG_07023 [Hirsutella rhossiliensis]KAH0961943.1 hypothetical protein HRG_07023 [Hirsutella rhossiliensis]
MAASASQALRSMRERSIRVLVTPTPLTFAERRSVLQVLEQHGPVEVFKMTPGFNANFMSVTKHSATASRLVASSPLTYSIPVPRETTEVSLAGIDEPAPFDAHPPLTSGAAASDRDSVPDSQYKEFKLNVFPEPDYQHRFAMAPSPLCQPWPPVYEQDRSFMAAVLKQSLPRTIAAKGLAHWFLDFNKPAQSYKARRLQLKSWLPSKMKG